MPVTLPYFGRLKHLMLKVQRGDTSRFTMTGAQLPCLVSLGIFGCYNGSSLDLSSVTSLQCLRIEATAGNVEKLKLPSHCQLHVDLWDYATAMNGFDIVHKTLQMHAVALSSVCMNKILIGTGRELVVL